MYCSRRVGLSLTVLVLVLFVPRACTLADEPPKSLEQLAVEVEASQTVEDIAAQLPVLVGFLRNFDDSPRAIPLAERTIDRLQEIAPDAPADARLEWLYRELADAYFENGDLRGQRRTLERWRALFRQPSENARPWEPAEVQYANRVILDLLRTDQLDQALDMVAELLADPIPIEEPTRLGHTAVGAALHRRINQLSPSERYRRLMDWTLADGEVRIFSSIVPLDAPPPTFARALGERSGQSTFEIADVSGLRGLFCTGWELIAAAEQTGRLSECTAAIQKANDSHSKSILFALAGLQLGRFDAFQAFYDTWMERTNLVFSSEQGRVVRVPLLLNLEISDIILAATAARHPETRTAGIELLHRFETGAQRWELQKIRPTIQSVLAWSTLTPPSVAAASSSNPNLKHWLAVSQTGVHSAHDWASAAQWLSHEGHLVHLSGSIDDQLMLKAPLSGTFSFEMEAQSGGVYATEGGLSYGGFNFSVWPPDRALKIWNDVVESRCQIPFDFVRQSDWSTYQRYRFDVSETHTELRINGHPAWRETNSRHTSPWLSLRSFGGRCPAFRNMKITGQPTIPDQVTLLGERGLAERGLRGWTQSSLAESHPETEFNQTQLLDVTSLDGWQNINGVVEHVYDKQTTLRADQSLLTYTRPLLDQEVITYEFYYEQETVAVHPALGRIVFLLQPDGVWLHWVTDGDDDWTGLRSDNSTFEPLNRRGPAQLPLVEGGWNRVRMQLQQRTLQIQLNDVLVYERALAPERSTRFSLFHHDQQAVARVRRVQLSGNWSPSLEALLNNDLLTPLDEEQHRNLSPAVDALLQERHMTDCARKVHAHANSLKLEQRYAFLKSWVLPNSEHRAIRLHLDFSRTHPPVNELDESQRAADGARIEYGGQMVSPALDLLTTASELGQLDELITELDALHVSEEQELERLVLLSMALQERGDVDRAIDLALASLNLIDRREYHSFADYWPETLLLEKSLENGEMRDFLAEFAGRLLDFRVRIEGAVVGPIAWRQYVAAWGHQYRYDHLMRPVDDRESTPVEKPHPARWVPATRVSAWSRGQGFPVETWKFRDFEAQSVSRHDAGSLFYQSPLTGNFEIECDITAFNYYDCHLLYGCLFSGPHWSRDSIENGDIRNWNERIPLQAPQVSEYGPWIRARMTVEDGIVNVTFNGRHVRTYPLPAGAPPWFAVRTHNFTFPGFRDLRITGTPRVPESVSLSDNADLLPWVAYYQEPVGNEPGAHWSRDDDGVIIGRRVSEIAGQFSERLLYVQRPLSEDGTIEYEFYYTPGQYAAHPALDRMVFYLQPDGVRIHALTDRDFEPSLAADSLSEAVLEGTPAAGLPLKQNEWNSLKFVLQGNQVELILNDVPIGRAAVSSGNQRYFGLFHYEDRSELRVRNVVWSGDWPRTVPSLSEQRLVDQSVREIENTAYDLPLQFYHSFAREGFPVDKFRQFDRGPKKTVEVVEGGLKMTLEETGKWSELRIAPEIAIAGDFDIVLRYHDYSVKNEPMRGRTGLNLRCNLLDEESTHWTIARNDQDHSPNGKTRNVEASYDRFLSDRGHKWHSYGRVSEECTAGTLRMIRRGDRIYFLVSEDDSPNYRLIHSEETSTAPSVPSGIRARLTFYSAQGGTFFGTVVLDSLLIRAEETDAGVFRSLN